MQKSYWPAIVVLMGFLVIGTLFAVYTPKWQLPDEPAHYNYIRQLVETGRFPVMEMGDYDQAYLSRLTSERFPPELSINAVAYEDHQPPLYYVLAVPVYALSGGSVVVLRIFTLFLGGIAVVMAMMMLREAWPELHGVIWFASGLVAFTPQFVAMMAAVNNDALTLALLWLWLALALRYLRGDNSLWILGGVLGLILLTKSTGYGALVLAVLAVFLKHRQKTANGKPVIHILRDLASIFGPALLVGGIWWIRNISVYGWPDFMGLIRHDEVVVGQPRTIDAISTQGLSPFLWSAIRTTFQSYWGQFGWMGVVLDNRIYRGLLIFSFCAMIGAIGYFIHRITEIKDPQHRNVLILLGASTVMTVSMFVGYNLSFIQHQGRYLFPALPMVAMMMSLGLKYLLERKMAIVITAILIIIVVVMGVWGVLNGDIQLWWVLLMGIAISIILSTIFVPKSWHVIYAGLLLFMLALLDLLCLFGFIVPMLT